MKRILIAEDNRSFRMMLTLVFSEQYQVQTVDNGESLEQELVTGEYDMLIADLNLPRKLTSSVLRQYDRMCTLDGQMDLKPVPTLIVTGMEEDCEEVQSIRRLPGVLEVFEKPVDFKVLKRRVDEALQEGFSEPLCSQVARAVATLPRVLIVDDEPGIRQFLYAVLDGAGIQARTCATAKEAVELCRKNVFDVMLLDYVLEDCLADEVLKALPEATKWTKLPSVMIVTGFEDSVNRKQLDQYPCVKRMLPKPFDPDQLVQGVKECLGKPQLVACA